MSPAASSSRAALRRLLIGWSALACCGLLTPAAAQAQTFQITGEPIAGHILRVAEAEALPPESVVAVTWRACAAPDAGSGCVWIGYSSRLHLGADLVGAYLQAVVVVRTGQGDATTLTAFTPAIRRNETDTERIQREARERLAWQQAQDAARHQARLRRSARLAAQLRTADGGPVAAEQVMAARVPGWSAISDVREELALVLRLDASLPVRTRGSRRNVRVPVLAVDNPGPTPLTVTARVSLRLKGVRRTTRLSTWSTTLAPERTGVLQPKLPAEQLRALRKRRSGQLEFAVSLSGAQTAQVTTSVKLHSR